MFANRSFAKYLVLERNFNDVLGSFQVVEKINQLIAIFVNVGINNHYYNR